jgi:hypothetical protein
MSSETPTVSSRCTQPGLSITSAATAQINNSAIAPTTPQFMVCSELS